MKTDSQLLESYVRQGSDGAFRELVQRHIHLIHSAALRESRGNAAQAQDITQAVFTELARRAGSLARHPALAGWLYTCVRRIAANVRRSENRRQRREWEASTMNEILGPDPTDKLWQQLRPALDDVMHELNEKDRTAVVLRFFEGQSLRDVGLALGLNENAARMRVERALEKLRDLLSRRGVKSTAATLTVALALGTASSASAGLAATVATSALKSAASSPAAFSMANFLGATKLKFAAAGAVILVAATVLAYSVHSSSTKAHEAIRADGDLAANGLAAAGTNGATTAALSTSGATNTAPEMTLHVVEAETGTPLPGVKIDLGYFGNNSEEGLNCVTDTNGESKVEALQPPFTSLNLFATAEGHVPKVVSWYLGAVLPDEYTLKMPRGTVIAGSVTDEAGKPIPGATIQFAPPYGIDGSQQENIQFGPDTSVQTDSNGHWHCSMVPKDAEHVSLVITHPNYAETDAKISPTAPDAKNLVITMASGVTVAGAVTDSNGLAIAGAKVRQVRQNSEGEASHMTDGLGNFAFKNMKTGELILSVQADGFAPAVRTLQVTNSIAPMLFQLGPGNLLRGHVVDENGNPIPHVRAKTEFDQTGIRKVEWSTETGASDAFEWDSAPPEPLYLTFSAEGFESAYRTSLLANGSDHEIVLKHVQHAKDLIQINGTVVAEDTGQPVDGFTVRLARIEATWVQPFRFATVGKNGKFTLLAPISNLGAIYEVEVEKEGYLPTLSTNARATDGNQTLSFKLQRGSGPCGVVYLPSGEPAANAAVFLCTEQGGVTLDGPAHVATVFNNYDVRCQRPNYRDTLMLSAIPSLNGG